MDITKLPKAIVGDPDQGLPGRPDKSAAPQSREHEWCWESTFVPRYPGGLPREHDMHTDIIHECIWADPAYRGVGSAKEHVPRVVKPKASSEKTAGKPANRDGEEIRGEAERALAQANTDI